MSNIREVAKLAGVSVATVSRTLTFPERVAEATRKKVSAAIQETGYKPNLMAVQFRSRKTLNLVILVPSIANVFYSRIISGAQRAARDLGYRVLLCDTQGNETLEREFAQLIEAHQADGVIQLRAFDPFEDQPSKTIPLVNVCEVLESRRYPSLCLDNLQAAKAMTQYLIELGHRRIGLIQGPTESPLTRGRIAGYLEALDEAAVEVDTDLVCHGDFSLEAGYEGARKLLALIERPTALFCENDEMAIGALRYLNEQGVQVPRDISLAGFDDISFASFCTPPLTTVAQPAELFGMRAVEMLVDVIEGRSVGGVHEVLPFELRVRASTAPPP
ncbi:LacI family DNA-binding transcriptional regulator [Pseudomonas sp. 18175]|uniref:LacI family DNA-binding transcriptional regulator n=1 Tax=Pseudomonas sp. 18175 TaxID=3390056 RepID=UPI003D244CA1